MPSRQPPTGHRRHHNEVASATRRGPPPWRIRVVAALCVREAALGLRHVSGFPLHHGSSTGVCSCRRGSQQLVWNQVSAREQGQVRNKRIHACCRLWRVPLLSASLLTDFLRCREGVVVLPSGLQYKVLREGDGEAHPLVSTSCECHYEGRIAQEWSKSPQGKKFDSSYDRGSPTSFAPNGVIKGWTEAMQLMVEGDKWEMYIPSELGYGESGQGSDIGPGDVLVFTMEIIKINGETKPANRGPPPYEEFKDVADYDRWAQATSSSGLAVLGMFRQPTVRERCRCCSATARKAVARTGSPEHQER